MGPLSVALKFGDEMTVDKLVRNHGAWHNSCYIKFNKLKLDRATKKRERDAFSESSTTEQKRPRRQSVDNLTCLFCQQGTGQVHEITTLGADETIRQMATELQETHLMARIEGGDLIALDAKYHLECYISLRNRYRTLMRKKEQESGSSSVEKQVKERALIELFSYIENCVEDGTIFLKFSVLHQLYENRLQKLGIVKEINRTRLKEKILARFPQEQFDGKNNVLVFEQGMTLLLKQNMASDYEGDALVLAKAANIVRREISSHTGFSFDGSFPSSCQRESVPSALKMLVSMLLNGANLKDQDSTDSQANLTVPQIILFNSKKRASSYVNSRHSLYKEPPLPLYIGLKVHTKTRSKKIITQLHELGISVSYDRVLQLENQLATAVCENFQTKGVVVPAQLRHGVFTIGALDNLDHNPSSTTAKGSFHGTGISLFQCPRYSDCEGKQDEIRLPPPDTNKNHQLPNAYTTVPAVALKVTDVSVPQVSNPTVPQLGQLERAQRKEKIWIERARKLLKKNELGKGDTIAWSAFHASLQDELADPLTCLTQLLPLFYEKAATAAMIKHGMNVLYWATEFLNPGQTPLWHLMRRSMHLPNSLNGSGRRPTVRISSLQCLEACI